MTRFRLHTTGDRPDGQLRTFNRLVSCFHLWELCVETVRGKDGKDYHTVIDACTVCKATCKRDKIGRIVEYSAYGVLDEVTTELAQ